MSERHLYDSDSQFKGSIDDDGRIYDTTHRYIGRIENGTVYDYRDIPQGTVRENGMVMDNFRHEVGQSFGTGFSGPTSVSREEKGYVRSDIASQGHGSDYGAFILADRARRPLGTCDEDIDDGAMDDEDDDCSSGSDPWEPHAPQRARYPACPILPPPQITPVLLYYAHRKSRRKFNRSEAYEEVM